MAKKIYVKASSVSNAKPEDVFALLVNSATYPFWSVIRHYESLGAGHNGLHDVGALRLFKTNAITVMRERITEVVPNQRVGYSLLSGFPLLDYQSLQTLEEIDQGTRITWESSFIPKYPLTGFFWRSLMSYVLKTMAAALAEAAADPERRAAILALSQGSTSDKRPIRAVKPGELATASYSAIS